MKLFFFCTVMMMMITTNGPLHAWPEPTRGGSGVNLNGKMFTLGGYNGGLILYSPYRPSPWATPTPDQRSTWATPTPDQRSTRPTPTPDQRSTWATPTPDQRSTRPTPTPDQRSTWATPTPDQRSTRPTPTPDQTRGYTSGYYSTSTPSYTETNTGNTETSAPFTSTTPKPTTKHPTTPSEPTTRYHTTPWTTGPPRRGLSVCLRYITDSQGGPIFTLSSSSSVLRLSFNNVFYLLSVNYYNNVNFLTNVRFWSGLRPNMWTSVCITVDNVKGVAQIFRDSNMSPRKLLNNYYKWSSEPAIDFSGFEGQVTDVQMWDYPLRYKEILYYMSSGYYGPSVGSVLNWSYISYSTKGKTLLEDSFELQLSEPDHRRRHQLRGEDNPRKRFRVEQESKKRKRPDF